MSNKKYQVFISSTYEDLQEERRKLQDFLLSGPYIPVGMETFLGSAKTLPQHLKALIDGCDFYVVIVAARYGTVNAQGISWTEMEYDYAASTDIPILAFFRSSKDDLIEPIRKFRDKISTKVATTYWENPDDLKAKAFSMLSTTTTPRPGWQRAFSAEQTNATEATIPSLVFSSGIAFETCKIPIQFRHGGETTTRTYEMPELFEIIALEMADKAISEAHIVSALKKQLAKLPLSELLQFSDPQIVKRILFQLEQLQLIEQQNADSLWWLTPKGEIARNELILIKIQK